jgi:hypothetical protein
MSKSDRYAPHPNAPEVMIKVLAPTDLDQQGFSLALSHTTFLRVKSLPKELCRFLL